jgi:thioredoxin-related protein
MDAVTHPHPAVRAALGSWLEQRIDVSAEPELARVFGVHGVPALLALDGDGRILGRRTGFVEPRDLVDWLEATRAGAAR